MELLLELIFELIMDSSIEIAQDKKVNKWIRYPVAIFLSAFVIAVLGLLLYLGINFLIDPDITIKVCGIVILAFDIILIISAIQKLKKINNDKDK